MHKILSLLPHILSVGSAGVGLSGFVEVPWIGGQVMIVDHPSDPLFVKSAYLFLLLAGGTGVLLVLSGFTSDRIKGLRDNTIRELDELQKCGEELYKWGSRNPVDMQNIPPPSVSLRHIILQKKVQSIWIHKRTLIDREGAS